jgi:hypothetical protein
VLEDAGSIYVVVGAHAANGYSGVPAQHGGCLMSSCVIPKKPFERFRRHSRSELRFRITPVVTRFSDAD